MRSRAIVLAATALVWVATLGAPTPARAADFHVTATADEVVDDGECTLREAVIASNTNAAVDTCPAGSATDTDHILLAPGRYELTIAGAGEDDAATGDLDILGALSIHGGMIDHQVVGTANDTVVDGGGLDRVFDIHEGAETAIFNFLVISGGSAPGEDGGGIRHAAADPAPGGDCAFDRFDIANAVIRDNSAARGGGIFVDDCAFLDAAWISVVDNAATGDGGGIAVLAGGDLLMSVSTISGNVAGGVGGGAWLEAPPLAGGLFWTTVADNAATSAGGLWVDPPPGNLFSLGSTIFADNGGGNCTIAAAAQTIENVLSTDATCVLSGFGNLGSTDPRLSARDAEPVAYRLLPGSPAIDAGALHPLCVTINDQYGNPRPQDGDGDGVAGCDIGAHEAPGVPGPAASPTPGADGGGMPNTSMPGPGTMTAAGLVTALALVSAIALRLATGRRASRDR
jgi:CSLREA domain-containing protein